MLKLKYHFNLVVKNVTVIYVAGLITRQIAIHKIIIK